MYVKKKINLPREYRKENSSLLSKLRESEYALVHIFLENIDCNEVTGDINIDYMVNVIDIVALVNTILNNSNLEICQILSSDMDFNNELNIIDVVSLTQIILQN